MSSQRRGEAGLWHLMVLMAFVGFASPGYAQPLAIDDVPGPLRPWVAWVLDGDATAGCTWVGESRRCAWPGALALDVEEDGGTFAQRVYADRETWVPLVGGAEVFPHQVRVDGALAPVVERDEARVPHVRVTAGQHEITGTLRFGAMPELLRLPADVGLVSLRLDGEVVSAPRRNEEGMLWLRQRASEDVEGHMELEVFRRLEDGVPFRVTTRIRGRASGEAREVQIGTVPLEGMTPTQLDANVAARLTPAGVLSVQVRAGEFEVTVVSQREGPPTSLATGERSAPWPATETWVWASDESFRQVEVSGAPSIDPARTNLPGEWRSHPAYVVSADAALAFETTRRGEPAPPPNQVSLHRTMWLDIDGQGYTVRDELSGRIHQGWRVSLVDGSLGSVTVGGEPQLITRGGEGQTAGVEVRRGRLDLSADSRLEGGGDLPAVGWSEDVQSLSSTLHLPPGWSLFAVSGVDEASGTWVERWDLWGIFFVLLMALSLGRLLGARWGLLALLTLTLSYHSPGAPLFSWLGVVALFGLMRVVRRGIAARVVRGGWWIALTIAVLVAVPFSADQLVNSLFPFADASRRTSGSLMDLGVAEPMPSAPAVTEAGEFDEEAMDVPAGAPALEQDGRRRLANRYGVSGSEGFGGGRGPSARLQQSWLDPNAVIQTGPGVPTWQFRRWQLRWSGPVDREQRLRLWLVPPWANRLLGVLRVLLLGFLLGAIVRRRPPPDEAPPTAVPPTAVPPTGGKPTSTASAVGLLLAMLLGFSSSAYAQPVPSAEQLEELGRRLRRPPACAPRCVLASELSVRVEGERLILDAVVHAGAAAVYRIPGPSDRWLPDRVEVDGRPSDQLALLDERFLFLRLEGGQHRVHLEGGIRGGQSLTLAFGEPPRRVSVEAPGWNVEGVRTDGQASPTIQLRRRLRVDAERIEDELPSWLLVHRTLDLGVRWTLRSRVERVTPTGSPVVVRIPVLEGESVTDARVLVEDDEVVVTLGRDDASIEWTSVLEPRPTVTLTAPEGERWSEIWALACSPIWHCEHDGMAPVAHQRDGLWQPRFRPWPGDEVSFSITRPEAAEGQSATIDSARMVLTPGARSLRASLTLAIRASRGGVQTIGLPEGAEVQGLDVGGQARPVQEEDGGVRVTLEPGTSTLRLRWQQPSELGTVFMSPAVRLSGDAVNAEVEVELPSDRWLLWTAGPSWGVALLFWPYLLLVFLLALVLARQRALPLRAVEWMLLGLGLTQIHPVAALVVVGWFFVMEHRGRPRELAAWQHNLRQLLIPGYTLVALGCLYAAVHIGLLMQPDMQVVSGRGGDAAHLRWYVDRVDGTLPQPWLVSLPIWVWRVTMLLWSLWLASSVVRWARWGWKAYASRALWLPMAPGRAAQSGASGDAAQPGASFEAPPSGTATAPVEPRPEDGDAPRSVDATAREVQSAAAGEEE